LEDSINGGLEIFEFVAQIAAQRKVSSMEGVAHGFLTFKTKLRKRKRFTITFTYLRMPAG
jgi:hypothetical protein